MSIIAKLYLIKGIWSQARNKIPAVHWFWYATSNFSSDVIVIKYKISF